MKKFIKFLTGRLFVTSFFILIQLLILFFTFYYLSTYSTYIYMAMVMLSFLLAVKIAGNDSNPNFKIAWIIPMLTLPFFGWTLYLVLGRRKTTSKMKKRYQKASSSSLGILQDDEEIMREIRDLNDSVYRQCVYIKNTAKTNVFKNTQTEYFKTGEEFFEVYKQELKNAQKFIFLEYFIIDKGQMWDEILGILISKALAGVEVRVMYDDMGTINRLEKGYDEKLRKYGIKVCIFNSFRPSLDAFMNYRDHRKITVIDGNVAFTGGLNLADEYINAIERFGYWKDCALMLKGDAVSALSIMFLHLWNFTAKEDKPDYLPYLSTKAYPQDGYVIPFGDGPMSGHLTGKLSYINLINHAKNYVYIATPYLIIDNEMITALKIADQSGVDVRIITPHIPDKWYVHTVTRSNYEILVKAGIRIYEYKPGFIHSKFIIADDEVGIVGTTNFDFRSFYLHFENGVFMYKSKALEQVKADCIEIFKQCIEITPEMCKDVPFIKKFGQAFMKLFSPFM